MASRADPSTPSDAHDLRAADKLVNGNRGNLDFDEGGQAHDECTVCRFDADSWDPGRSRRGDVARALLYTDLRYDRSDGGTPDLELVDRTTSIGEPHFGHLCTLLVWHEEDLVDDAERRRNDVVFRWQGNRIRSSTIPSGCRAFGVVRANEHEAFGTYGRQSDIDTSASGVMTASRG